MSTSHCRDTAIASTSHCRDTAIASTSQMSSRDDGALVIGRESQMEILLRAFGGEPCSCLPSALFLWGMSATGKSFVLNKAIEISGVTHTARISSSEILCGKRPFFETILRQLGITGDAKCDTLRIFVRQVAEMTEGKKERGEDTRVIVILDEAEYLRKEYPDILDVFLNLQEFTQGNVCLVVSSFLPPVSFSTIPSMQGILRIHFPQYTKDEIIKIIGTCYVPSDVVENEDSMEVFKFFVKMVADVFYTSCRDLKKLLRLTKSNWNEFNCISTSERKGDGTLMKLFRNIQPRLKEEFKALSSNVLPMKNISGNGTDNNRSQLLSPSTSTGSSSNSRNIKDIPKYQRFLLISSYLATHNPPASDKRYFVKGGAKSTRKSSKYNVGGGLNRVKDMEDEEKSNTLKSFDLNRLKAIVGFMVHYCSRGTDTFEPSADILMQISSLCQARFLQSMGEDSSGNFKYRCLADYEFITDVAKSVDFELDKYLYRLL